MFYGTSPTSRADNMLTAFGQNPREPRRHTTPPFKNRRPALRPKNRQFRHAVYLSVGVASPAANYPVHYQARIHHSQQPVTNYPVFSVVLVMLDIADESCKGMLVSS